MGTPISSLPLASTPTGTEYVPIVQSGTTKRTTLLDAAKTLLPITTDEISDGNITAAKLAPDAVTTAKIADANVTSAKLASGAALTNIGTGGITSNELAGDSVTTAKIANANITAAKLDGAQSGSAPIYGARAWVNFNGTGTVAIRASGNVSSVTDNGTGDYTINFATAMPDANFATVCAGIGTNDPITGINSLGSGAKTTSSVRVSTTNQTSGRNDFQNVEIAVFR